MSSNTIYTGDSRALSDGASVTFKEALSASRGNLVELKERLWSQLYDAHDGEVLEGMRAYAGEPRDASPFIEDTEINFDDLMIQVGRDRLVVTSDLLSRPGISKTLPNFMAKATHRWNKVTESGKAQRAFHLPSRGQSTIADFTYDEVPLPLTFFIWEQHVRDLMIAKSEGNPWDTTHIEHNVRRVNEMIEDSVINGFKESYSGKPVYGALNHPNVGTYTFAGGAWTLPAVGGQDIYDDVYGMWKVGRQRKRRGNKILYVPLDYDEKLDSAWSDLYDGGSIRNYLLSNISWLDAIISVDYLPADTVVMLDPEPENVELINTGGMVILPYNIEGTFVDKWIGFTGLVPAFKDDAEGYTGTIVGTP